MGTDIQEVLDSFTIKVPTFSGSLDYAMQLMKSAIAKVYRHTYDKLDYHYDAESKTGSFDSKISNASVELIALAMACDYYLREIGFLTTRKEYVGTQAFNKIPSNKDKLTVLKGNYEKWVEELQMFVEEFPDYSDER